MTHHDTLIRNVRIVDGTGREPEAGRSTWPWPPGASPPSRPPAPPRLDG